VGEWPDDWEGGIPRWSGEGPPLALLLRGECSDVELEWKMSEWGAWWSE
jgi:hypothetical protein